MIGKLSRLTIIKVYVKKIANLADMMKKKEDLYVLVKLNIQFL